MRPSTFAIFVWITTLALSVTILGSYFEGMGLIIGFALWLALVGSTLKIFLVSVPEITGLVTVNYFGGNLMEYETGLNFRFPWEQVKDGNYIDLRLKTVIVSEDYPSKDGPLIATKWSYQFKPKKGFLPIYIGIGISTIEEGLTQVGSSFMSAKIGIKNASDIKKEQETIEAELQEAFENTEVEVDVKQPDGSTKKEKMKLEAIYGIDLVRVSLADVDYEARYQRARESEQVAARLRQIANEIRKNMPGISDKDAMNIALIVNGDVQKHVQEVEGEGGKYLAGLLMSMARGGQTSPQNNERKGGKK